MANYNVMTDAYVCLATAIQHLTASDAFAQDLAADKNSGTVTSFANYRDAPETGLRAVIGSRSGSERPRACTVCGHELLESPFTAVAKQK